MAQRSNDRNKRATEDTTAADDFYRHDNDQRKQAAPRREPRRVNLSQRVFVRRDQLLHFLDEQRLRVDAPRQSSINQGAAMHAPWRQTPSSTTRQSSSSTSPSSSSRLCRSSLCRRLESPRASCASERSCFRSAPALCDAGKNKTRKTKKFVRRTRRHAQRRRARAIPTCLLRRRPLAQRL